MVPHNAQVTINRSTAARTANSHPVLRLWASSFVSTTSFNTARANKQQKQAADVGLLLAGQVLERTQHSELTFVMSAQGGKWRNGARAAIAFTIDNMGEAADLDRDLWPASQPVGSHYSVMEVLPQFLDLLRKHDIKATYFIESSNMKLYPEAIRDVAMAGHEVAWHAWRHEAWSKLDEKAEKANFDRSFGAEGLAGFVSEGGLGNGVVDQYRGFRPPGGIIHGDRTLKLCRQHGLSYISPAAEDAALVTLENSDDKIAILPFRWRTVDAFYYMEAFGGLRKAKGEDSDAVQSPETLARQYIHEIDAAVESDGFLSLLFHPFLTNEPARMKAMETVVEYLVRKRDAGQIWLARCRDIADWIHEQPDTVGEDPRWDTTSWR